MTNDKNLTDVPNLVLTMATLVKRPGSPYWFVAFDVPMPDGSIRRLKKSTKKRKRSDALVEAVRLEELERKSAASSKDEGEKAYSILAEAAESAAKGELSESRARVLLAKLAEASTGVALRFYTVRSWAEDWLAAKRSTTKPSTITRYTASVGAFLQWLGERADGRMESVTKADVRGFRDAIRTGWKAGGKKASPRSAKTANSFARDIAGLFRSAVREGILLASPASALESLPEDDSIEREVFSFAEVAKLVEASCGEEWQRAIFSARTADLNQEIARRRDWPGIILVGFYSGARLKDAASLTWNNVDQDNDVLCFMPAKTARKRKRLEIPLHPRLAAFFKSHDVPKVKDGPIFPALANVRVSGNAGLSSCFGAIMDAAGVDRRTARESTKGKDGKIVRRAVHARSFHSLRHSLTSSLANLDVAAEIRQRIVGHDTAATHQAYTHTERETLARAVRKLPSV